MGILINLRLSKGYKKHIRNWLYVFVKYNLKRYPIKVITKSGGEFVADSWHDLQCKLIPFISSNFQGTTIISDQYHPGDLGGVFINDQYSFLNPLNTVVIDIGANIGDSTIYFAMSGATKVIAIEPFPDNYRLLIKNIEVNNLSGKVVALNAMLGTKTAWTQLKTVLSASLATRAEEGGHEGPKIGCISLSQLVQIYGGKRTILKMDCEGCEYESILLSETEVLRNFERILIEYHYGANKLVTKLRESGFEVKYTKPRYQFEDSALDKIMYQGYIFATRREV